MWDLDETLLSSEHLRSARHRRAPCILAELPEFNGTVLYDGIERAVRRLCHARSALITSSPRWYVDQLLDHVLPDVTFDLLVTYDDVRSIKPDPEALLLALTRLRVSPGHAVYIGDDHVDYAACLAADVRFLGAGWASAPTFPSSVEILAHPLDVLTVVELS